MKRLYFLISLLAMCVMTGWAKPVSKKAALQTAQQFMQQQMSATGVRRAPRLVSLNEAKASDCLYIFNAADGQGFVIVSGDDSTAPILAYSTCGNIDVDHMPENLRFWLQNYADQIALIQQQGLAAPQKTMADCGMPLASQLTSRWNQSPIYNDQCPMVTNYTDADCTQLYEYTGADGTPSTAPIRSVTGCGATALAQVLYQHKYPAATTADIPGRKDFVHMQTTSAGTNIWIKFSDDGIPAGMPIDWDYLADAYGFYYDDNGQKVEVTTTEEQNQAIAQLMHLCGAAMNMKYGSTLGIGSEATMDGIVNGLINYLGYKNAYLVSHTYYDYQEWVQMLYDELSIAECVYFSGSLSGGHAFVIDGYDKEDFFHVNWGWGGIFNGFFRINALSPATFNFSGSQMFLRGVYPGAPKLGKKELRVGYFKSGSKTVTRDADGFNIDHMYLSIINEKHANLSVEITFTLEGENTMINTNNAQITFDVSSKIAPHDIILSLGDIADGRYKFHPRYRLSDNDEWTPCLGTENAYITLTVSGETMTVENSEGPYTLSLVTTSAKNIYEAGEPIQFTASMKVENGSIHETVTDCLVPMDDTWTATAAPLTIGSKVCYGQEGDTFDIAVSLPGLAAGKYMYALSSSDYNILSPVCYIEVKNSTVNIASVRQPQADAAVYNLNGQRVTDHYRGIAVSNGKKAIVGTR